MSQVLARLTPELVSSSLSLSRSAGRFLTPLGTRLERVLGRGASEDNAAANYSSGAVGDSTSTACLSKSSARLSGSSLAHQHLSSFSFCRRYSQESSRPSYSPQRIGFVGVGAMGKPMCRNLLESGKSVVVCDTNEESLKEFKSLGADVVRTPAELATFEGVEAVISMLPSARHVEDVFTGSSGILSVGLKDIQPDFFIDCSSTGPKCSVHLQQALDEASKSAAGNKALTFVDAPVSGGVPGAEAATLTFMVGASTGEVFGKVEDVLVPTMGKKAVHCGTTGAGQSTKLCNNLVLGITMAGVCEAMALGQKLGLDPENLSRVFNSSSAQCWSTSLYNPCPGVMPGVPSSRDYENGFLTELMIKDLTSAQQAAESAQADIYLGKMANELYQKMETTHQRKDFSAIYKYIYNGESCLN